MRAAISSLAIFAALSTVACAKPAQKLKQAERTQEDVEANAEKQLGKLDKKQAAETAALERKQEEERVAKEAAERQKIADQQSKVYAAGGKVAALRVDIETTARERLGKIDAKAQELSTRTALLDESAKSRVSGVWSVFQAKRAQAAESISVLPAVADVQLAKWREDVGKRCDALDATLEQIESKLK